METIVCILIGILSGMGVGSAGLLVVYLTSFGGISQYTAQCMNLIFYIVATGASLLIHSKKRKLFPGIIFSTILLAIPGVILGGLTASIAPTTILRRIFGGMLVTAGTLTVLKFVKTQFLRRKKRPDSARN